VHPEQQRVTAEAVQPLFENLLDHSPTTSVLRLMEACVEGGLDGKNYFNCVYGTLTIGSGQSFVDNTDVEVREKIRDFGLNFGIYIRADRNLDDIERFVAHVTRDDTRLTSPALDHIFRWCNESLLRRPRPITSPENIYENAGEAVGA
jgi:hypothetical protein